MLICASTYWNRCLFEKSQEMNCKEVENHIWQYIEGSLDTILRDDVEKHIQSCAQCAALEKGIRTSMSIIEHLKKTEADPFYFTRLEARMEQQKVLNPKSSIAIRYALAASIAFIIIIGGGVLGNFSAEQWSVNFVNEVNVNQLEDFESEFADNSFDLLKEFE